MTTPSQNPDDSWAELYSELGLEPETVAAKPVAEAPPLEFDAEGAEAEQEGEFADSSEQSDDDTEGDDSEGESESAEGETSEEGGDPTKKKRRRRRRRRGGKKEDGTEPGVAGEEAEGDVAVATQDEEDGSNPEAARELIAKWDVPSWGEIVAGLFRPAGNNSR